NSIPESQIFNRQYQLRHPKLIVNRSLTRVFSAFDNLLILINEIENDFIKIKKLDDYNFSSLSRSILELIESINSFIEDCQHIFKVTTPVSEYTEKIDTKFVSEWLKKAKHPTQKDFFDSIKDYKTEIAYYINNCKHEHGRIDIVFGQNEKDLALGYIMKFIGDTDNGQMEILDLNKVKTLYLDINYHFYQLYNISELFCKYFQIAQKIFYGNELKVLSFDLKGFGVNDIINRMKYDDLLIFPNNDILFPKVNIEINSKY